MEEVVVTATPIKASKMQQSLSVSQVNAKQTKIQATFNTAQLLNAVPGVRSEASGGDGNANITVRGVPISAGGARYVQLQEDGLPVLQFGDIAFATADQFLRIDSSVERIEVVRGGSASTLATNSPGGVVNLVSKTGAEASAGITATTGLGFEQHRLDFYYGEPIANSNTRFFVAGFYRQGESARDAGQTLEQGGQIKANITQTFERGQLTLRGKYLRDKTPTLLPVPVRVVDGDIQALNGVDPRQAIFYSRHWPNDNTLNRNNQIVSTSINDGLRVDSLTLGGELQWDLSDTWLLANNFRHAQNQGRFVGIFPTDNGYSEGPFTYATGANRGEEYSGPVFSAVTFNVDLNNLDNTANDLRFNKSIDLSDETELNLGAGWYYAQQTLDLTWHFNQYLLQLTERNPALIANDQTSNSSPGLLAQGTDVFGGCCNRTFDIDYTTSSPYFNARLNQSHWHWQLSARQDHLSAEGFAIQAQDQQYDFSNQREVDYQVDEWSYSAGVTYLAHADLSVFARTSSGHSFSSDRILFEGFDLDGSRSVPVNQVEQTEAGIKWRNANTSVFVTLFNANTEETNFEATTQRFTDRRYNAYGLELESSYQLNNFTLRVGATYTDSRIQSAEDSSLERNTPRRQAYWSYQIQPTLDVRQWQLGLSLIGATQSWGDDANSIRLDGYTVLSGFVAYQATHNISVTLQANNLTDELAYSEVESSGHAARAYDGRTVTASFSVEF